MSYTASVITVSDLGSRGLRQDTSGPAVRAMLEDAGFTVVHTAIVPDERGQISALLRACADEKRINLILTTGGTGLSPRDVTPEATADVLEREIRAIPVAMWVEREGQFGNAERRTAVFEKAVDPPGEAKWDLWAFMEVAHRVLDGEQIDGKDAFDHLFGFVYDKGAHDFKNDGRETNRLLWEEYRIFSNPEMNDKAKAINDDADGTFGAKLKMEAKQLAPYEKYLAHHGMTWPVRNVDGKWLETHWRFADGKQADGFDEVGVKQYGKPGQAGGVSFYKSANLKPSVVFRPYEPPAQTPSDEYPFYFVTGRLLEHWHTGTMTRRVPELDRALPEALLNMNPDDCKKLGIQDGDMVKVKSTYGEFDIKVSTAGRTEPPAGVTFAPFFAEETLVNLAVQDVYCPLSKEPDYKKTCVSITKL